jgi:hypothetical protein
MWVVHAGMAKQTHKATKGSAAILSIDDEEEKPVIKLIVTTSLISRRTG